MANDLTGDFDVVAEFATPAVNRVLAAMHRSERFLHSMSIRVDDNHPPGSIVRPTVVGSVDTFGDPIVNHQHIGTPNPSPGQLAATDPIYSALDVVVNTDVVGATVAPIVPSYLQGRAQLQLFPPTIEVADGSGTNLTVRLQMMARYFPDPHTSPLAEFIRGELQITSAVNQAVSQAASVVDIDFKSDSAYINFSPAWSSHPLSAEDLAGVNLLIRNALKTSFLPSNTTLPSNIQHMQFKTLLGAQSAIAVLLNMQSGPGNPASMNDVFLGAEDDFAFAAGVDYVKNAFHLDLSQTYDKWGYIISLNSAEIALQDGKIVVTVSGHAEGKHWYSPPAFDFTIYQDFTLKPASMTPGSPLNTAELVPGDIGGGVTGWLVSSFGGNFLDAVGQQPGQQSPQDTVRSMFNVDANLGDFLKSLLTPAHPQATPEPLEFQLAYTSVEITPSGIVLHGSLAVTDWPAAHVEFEQIPANSGGSGLVLPSGPDYSALRSWIPGGTIQAYEWRSQGEAQPFLIDDNKFVLVHAPPEFTSATPSSATPSSTAEPGRPQVVGVSQPVRGYTPLCLTVRGVRLSSSGPVAAQPVTASACGYTSIPVIPVGLASVFNGALPPVALAHPGPRGGLEVAGHTLARAGSGTPNLIVHFGDDKSAGRLDLLTEALGESRREDAATAVLAVLTPEGLTKAGYTQGVIYAEDQDGAWERVFGVKTTRRPVTLIVVPKGEVVWQHEGELDRESLAGALRKVLARGRSVSPRMLGSNLKIGRPAPNFLFEYAPGRQLTLRKLAGRSCILVFWKSSSKPSIEAVRDFEKMSSSAAGKGPVVLAINDGETPALAKRVAAENGLSAILVTDQKPEISFAYGVNVWPTIVLIDESGLVRGVRYGRLPGEPVQSPSGQTTGAFTVSDERSQML